MLSMIRNRRSIRVFQNKKVEKKKIEQMIQAALLSPSSKNNKPWKFIIVEDKGVLLKLSNAKTHGSQFLSKAPLVMVVIADPQKSDVWVEDASIAATMIILTAYHLNLGSCWIQIRKRKRSDSQGSEEFVRDLLGIPDNLSVLCMVAIGYADEEKLSNTIKTEKLNDVYYNYYNNQWKKIGN